MHKLLPKIIQENCFDFWWDNSKVYAQDVQVEEINVKELEWIFDLPFWSNDNVDYCLTPNDFMSNPSKYPRHLERLAKCDTSYPIDIMQNLKGKWLILDGLHRLVKLVMDGNTKIKVRKLTRDLIPQIIRTDDSQTSVKISYKALILPYTENHEILIQARSNINKEIKMPWGYFGGGIEENETAIQAVIRETQEELSIKVNEDELEFIGIFTDQPLPDKKIIRHVFLYKLKINLSEIKLQEGKAMKLFRPRNAKDLMILDADKNIAIAAEKFLNQK